MDGDKHKKILSLGCDGATFSTTLNLLWGYCQASFRIMKKLRQVYSNTDYKKLGQKLNYEI